MMKALSIRAPWWWWILHGGKAIENRTWSTNFRGTFLIQGSASARAGEIAEDNVFALKVAARAGSEFLQPGQTIACATLSKAYAGHIVGMADLVDCLPPTETPENPWHMPGQYGWKLENIIPLEHPFPVKGRLGFFPVGLLTGEVNSIIASKPFAK